MSQQQTIPQPQQETPYVFQRLERVKERLSTDHLQDYLDAPRQELYLHTTATYLAQHLLEVYRRYAEEALNAIGSDGATPYARQYLKISTNDTGNTIVQVRVGTADIERLSATLAKTLEADGQDNAWDNLARRLATDISTWAFERMDNDLGSPVVKVMSETTFDAMLMTYAWPEDPTPLHDRVHHFLNLTAQQVAFDMMTTIEARTPSLEELEHLLGLREVAPSASSMRALLREEHLTVLSAAHYQAVREALYKNTFQRLDGIPWPTALLAMGTARGQAQLRPIIVDMQPLLPPEDVDAWAQRMWQQREALSDLDADALDALSALWLYQARTIQDDAVADVDELLTMRGLQAKLGGQGRRGGYRPAQRAAMLQALSHIQSLWLDMTALEVYEERNTRTNTRRRRSTQQAIQSRAFTITDLFGHVRIDGGIDVQKFIFRPGKVFAHVLFGPGRQTALLSAKALVYDPYRQRWEKRLARYLSYQWRCRAHNDNYLQPLRVATLLEAVGVKGELRYPARIREHLERTLDVLQRDRIIATWQYDRWDESLTAHPGWAQHWFQATILIEPPDSIRETYQRLVRHEVPTQRALTPADTLGACLTRRRQALGLSQIQAAEQIGVSPSYLNRLERGYRGKRLSPTVQRNIDAWLSAHVERDVPCGTVAQS